jgi:hypothetical protein
MDRQARTRDTVLVYSREMTRKEPSTAVMAEGRGKDDRKNTLALSVKNLQEKMYKKIKEKEEWKRGGGRRRGVAFSLLLLGPCFLANMRRFLF